MTTALTDPTTRPQYIVAHRVDYGTRGIVTAMPCQYADTEVCGHAKGCACHTHSSSEFVAGLNDLLAHTYKAPEIVVSSEVRYLSYVPGSAEWLTSPFPTPRQEA